jgi:hypothetical protein
MALMRIALRRPLADQPPANRRRLADRRRRDGTRSVLAQAALSTLIKDGDRGWQAVIDEVWAMWLDEPEEVLWEGLTRWHRPALVGRPVGDAGWDPILRGLSLVALDEGSMDDMAVRSALAEAAVRTDHPIGEIARRRILSGDGNVVDAVCAEATTRPALAALCLEHGLAPSDPLDAAVFFLLTGQTEHHRAVDPDGSLLALGYQSATAEVRRRLRTAMVEAGDLDVAQVLVRTGKRDRQAHPTAEEARHLAIRLADRRAWDELWRLVQHLPLLEAVTAARLFDAWRPAGDRDRTLFDRLTGAAPKPLAEARRALTTFDTTRIEVPEFVHDGSFSLDGRRLAVLTMPHRHSPGQGTIRVFDLAGGGLVEQYAMTEAVRPVFRLDVHFALLGDVLIASELRPLPGTTHDVHSVLSWCSGGHVEERESLRAVGALVPSPARGGGFVICIRRDGELQFRGGGGDLVSTVRLRDVLGTAERIPPIRALAIEPGSGRLAVAGDGLTIFDARDAAHVRLLAHEPTMIRDVVFLDQNRLVTTDSHQGVRLWQLTGNRLEHRTAPVRPGPLPQRILTWEIEAHSPIVIPQRGEIAVLGHVPDVFGRGDVHRKPADVWYLDAESLRVINEPRELTGTRGRALWTSPDGARHALGGEGFVDVVSPVHSSAVTAIAERPLAKMAPADLATVSQALRDTPPGSATRPFLELLRDCLEHRFASDVQLGTAAPATGGPHDIALAEEAEGDQGPW